jgi:hypothetical protein
VSEPSEASRKQLAPDERDSSLDSPRSNSRTSTPTRNWAGRCRRAAKAAFTSTTRSRESTTQHGMAARTATATSGEFKREAGGMKETIGEFYEPIAR